MRHRKRHTFVFFPGTFLVLSIIVPLCVARASQRTSTSSRNSIAAVIVDEPTDIQNAAELLAAVQQQQEEAEKPKISYELYSPDESVGAEITTPSPLGNCPPQKPLIAPLSCPRRPRQPECEVHTDCPHTYLCCNHGCTKKCKFHQIVRSAFSSLFGTDFVTQVLVYVSTTAPPNLKRFIQRLRVRS